MVDERQVYGERTNEITSLFRKESPYEFFDYDSHLRISNAAQEVAKNNPDKTPKECLEILKEKMNDRRREVARLLREERPYGSMDWTSEALRVANKNHDKTPKECIEILKVKMDASDITNRKILQIEKATIPVVRWAIIIGVLFFVGYCTFRPTSTPLFSEPPWGERPYDGR